MFYNEIPLNSDWAQCIYSGALVDEADLYSFVRHHDTGYSEDREYLLESLEAQQSESEVNGVDINQSLTPCFFMYPWAGYDTKTQTACQAEACSSSPSIRDVVRREHGTWRIAREILGVPYDRHQPAKANLLGFLCSRSAPAPSIAGSRPNRLRA